MSVTLTAQPLEAVPAGNCSKYALQLSSAGTGNLVYSIGYEFYVGGEKLAGLEEIGWTGAAEDFNPANILRSQVKATLMGYYASSAIPDPTAVQQFYLKYGQLEYNTETCDKQTALGNQSATRYAVSSIFPWYIDPTVINGSDPVVLTERPSRIQIYTNQRDWIHVWRKSGAIGVRYRGYNYAGILVRESVTNRTANRQVYIFPVGPGNGFFPWDPDIAYYDIEVHNQPIASQDDDADIALIESEPMDVGIQAIIWSCRFVVASCENQAAPNDEIYFEEPLGGYSGLKFLEVQGRSAITSSRYRAGVPCGVAFPGEGQNYGTTRYRIEAYSGFQVRTELEYTDGIDRWLNAFFSARNHYRKFQMPDGTFAYEKAILSDGSYNILNNRETVVVEATFDSHLSRV